MRFNFDVPPCGTGWSRATSLLATGLLCLVLVQCGTERNPTTSAGDVRREREAGGAAGVMQLGQGGNARRSELGFAGDQTQTSTLGVCSLASASDFDVCAADAAQGSLCDGSQPACELEGEAGASGVLICETMFYPHLWNEAVALTSPCDTRAVASCPVEEPANADAVVRDVMTRCLGDESSMTVLFEHGCASYVVSSAHLPEQTSCVVSELDGKRYPCLGTATCGQAQYSTLP